MKLQPFHVFKAEMTRLNHLYWTSSYCFSRTAAILKAIATLGFEDSAPRVDQIWPSTINGESRRITVPTTEFNDRLDALLTDLRTTSILQACSAFENALVNYFVICLLYRPTACSRFINLLPLPDLISTEANYIQALTDMPATAGGILGGKYSRRIREIGSRFGLQLAPMERLIELDAHYEKRHQVAHTQSLSVSDVPNWTYKEILNNRLSITEEEWKAMLSDFSKTIESLDECIQIEIVTDKFLGVAAHRLLTQYGSLRVHKLRLKLLREWGIDAKPKEISDICPRIGFRVTLHKRYSRRLIFR